MVAEGDGDDGEVRAEREDREESEEDVKREEKPGVGRRRLERKLFYKNIRENLSLCLDIIFH